MDNVLEDTPGLSTGSSSETLVVNGTDEASTSWRDITDTINDFLSKDFDAIFPGFGDKNDPLNTFVEMWYQVFLWALFSSMFVHAIGAAIALCSLWQHKTGRCLPILFLIMGVLGPITGGAITSAAIAGVYRAASFQMLPFYALVWGVGQTFLGVILSFTRILATL